MLRLFLKNQPLVLFLIPVYVIAYLFLNYLTGYFEFSATLNLGLWGALKVDLLENYLPWLSGVIICINAYILNYIFNTNDFYEKNSYGVSLIYVVLLSYYRSFYFADGLLLAQTFILLGINILLKMEYNQDGKKKAFNLGFLFGVAACFHPVFIFIFPFLWFMMTRIRPFIAREFILVLLGMFLPIFYALLLAFYVNKEIKFNFIDSTEKYTQEQLIFLISVVLFLILFVSSWFSIRQKTQKSAIRFRKIIQIFYVFLIFSILIGSFDWIIYQQYEWFCYTVIPIALFLPFSYLDKKLTKLLYLLFFATVAFSVIKFFLKNVNTPF
jgi:hypothetical protein